MNIRKKIAAQRGSVILEAMIAILLFSIGILALVGMQASAVKNVADSKYRADAGFLADQIIGNIWSARMANASGVLYADSSFACSPCGALTGGNAVTRQWMASGVNAALPGASAVIAVDNVGRVEVIISWKPPKAIEPHTHSVVAYVD